MLYIDDTATTEICALSLHDALPITGTGCRGRSTCSGGRAPRSGVRAVPRRAPSRCRSDHRAITILVAATAHGVRARRSEEHTSELQSANISYAVFCLKKKHNPFAHA